MFKILLNMATEKQRVSVRTTLFIVLFSFFFSISPDKNSNEMNILGFRTTLMFIR